MSRLHLVRGIVIVLVLIGLPSFAAGAATPLQKCRAAKIKAATNLMSCIAKIAGGVVLKDTSESTAKCGETFAKRNTKTHKKFGPSCASLIDPSVELQRIQDTLAALTAIYGAVCSSTQCAPPAPVDTCQCDPPCGSGFTCCCCGAGTESGGATGTSVCVDLMTGKDPLGTDTNFCGSCTTWCHQTCTNGVCACPDGGPVCPDAACQAPSTCCVLEQDAWTCSNDGGVCVGG